MTKAKGETYVRMIQHFPFNLLSKAEASGGFNNGEGVTA